MPIHDWTRVDAGTFHSHHLGWMAALSGALNNSRLPPGFYSMTGFTTADGEPPPSVDADTIDELASYVARRRRVTIFGEPDDRGETALGRMSRACQSTIGLASSARQ